MNTLRLNLILFITICNINNFESRSFTIDYNLNTFIKDDKPFRYVSGSIHSYRVPKKLWNDRLLKMWSAGLNTIETYVFWNQHEPYPGVFDFDGQNNIFEFIELAQKIGFLIVLRPGPYVCAEHDYGGLPWWLLSNGTDNIIPRSSETNYMNAVRSYFSILLPKIKPYLYENGGSIISLQIENEYGDYYKCDQAYTLALRDLFRKYLGNNVVLFTTDGYPPERIHCGIIQEVLPTTDFGTDSDVNKSFNILRQYLTKGPLVNSEFYTGWLDVLLDFWNGTHSKVDTKLLIDKFEQIMNLNANVNFYMFHGGTNFGFSNGADPELSSTSGSDSYLPQLTSYDFDAPISESGDITNKYLAIRESISKYLSLPNVSIPNNSSKIKYGRIDLTDFIPLVYFVKELSNHSVFSRQPLSFEKLGQGYGFIVYSTKLNDVNVDGKILSIPGVLYRVNSTKLEINLKNNQNKMLYIIVENMGRLNFGDDLLDSKGILSDVELDGKILYNWTMYLTQNFIPQFQHNYSIIKNVIPKLKSKYNYEFGKVPGFYSGQFYSEDTNYDTFLKMEKFTKGIAFVSSQDTLTVLGRYWPKVGPQKTLYMPGVFTTEKVFNNIILMEFERTKCTSPDDCFVESIDYPIIG